MVSCIGPIQRGRGLGGLSSQTQHSVTPPISWWELFLLVKLVVSVLFSLDVAGLLFSPYVCNFVSGTLRIFTFILLSMAPAVLVFLSQICKCSFLSGSLPRWLPLSSACLRSLAVTVSVAPYSPAVTSLSRLNALLSRTRGSLSRSELGGTPSRPALIQAPQNVERAYLNGCVLTIDGWIGVYFLILRHFRGNLIYWIRCK